FFAFLTVPPGPPFPEHLHLKKMCGIVWCHTGTPEQAEKDLAPVRAFRKPALDFVPQMPYPALQSMFDPLYPPGLQWYCKADFFKGIPEGAIPQHVKYGADLPTMLSSMHIYPISGAAQKHSSTETPWSYRDADFALVIVGVDPDQANCDKITDWARGYYDAI